MKNIIPYSLKTIYYWFSKYFGSRICSNPQQPYLGHRTVPILTVGKLKFKDLNKNGKLDPTKIGDYLSIPESKTL
jgi:hypothetical protein